MSNAIRDQNLRTLSAFFAPETRGPGGARLRAALFREDGVKQLCYPIPPEHTGQPQEFPARDLLLHQPDCSCKLDLDCVIWATEDPDRFRAETIEQGPLSLCGRTGPFRGHSLHTFTFRDGLIQTWQVFPNTFTIYPTLGLEPADALAHLPEGAVQPPPLSEEAARALAENERRIAEELLPVLAVRSVTPVCSHGVRVRIKPYGVFLPEDEALREKNRAAVQLYFDKAGREARGISRNDLFTEDGLTEIPMDHMAPLNPGHHAFPTRPGPSGSPLDPYWHTDVIRFDATARPDMFWVETRSYHGEGAPEQPLPGMPTYTAKSYWNHYNFFFQLRDGKISYCREFLDPRSERRVMGIQETPLPEGALELYRYL